MYSMVKAIFLLMLTVQIRCQDFTLHIMHYNDFHARYTETDFEGKECSWIDAERELCFGGIARFKTVVHETERKFKNTILINVGDYSEGTLWQQVYGWKAAAHFLNQISHTAMGVGLHELDGGPEAFVPYMDNIFHPFICCNIDAANVSSWNNKLNKSIVIEVGGKKVGIIGYITKTAKYTTSPGLLHIGDEIECLQSEAEMLKSELGVDIIIAIGSAGYSIDKEIAKLPGIDVVVGAKSHTFLYTGTPPADDAAVGPYPTAVVKSDSNFGLVTQAYCYGKYLGLLHVDFDSEGNVKSWSGNPLLLDSTIIPDAEMNNEVNEWNMNLTVLMSTNVGVSRVYLDARMEICRIKECNMGNALTDAMVFKSLEYENDFEWNYVAVAITNAGGLRGYFDPREHNNGSVNMKSVLSLLPYKNVLVIVELKGEYIKASFEHSVSTLCPQSQLCKTEPSGRFLQISGLKVIVDLCKPIGQRVMKILVLCSGCLVPNYAPLQDENHYRIVTTEFIARGGDGFSVIADNVLSIHPLGVSDSEVFIDYLKVRGPVITGVEQRIIVLEENSCVANSVLRSVNCCTSWIYHLLLFSLLMHTQFQNIMILL